MAISNDQKVDYLFKKLGFAVSKTDVDSIKSAANESIASPLLIRGDKVWQQSADIPGIIPGSNTSIITVYDSTNPIECTEDITASANRTWKTELTDWIPPEFGSTYLVSVYVHTSSDANNAVDISNKVFVTGSGNDDEWFFDYQSGVLHFIGDNLPDGVDFTGKSVYITGARYTGTFGVGAAAGEDANLANLVISDTTISTANSGDNIILQPSSTGVVEIDTNAALIVPVGTTAQEPGVPAEGMIRYNSDTDDLEFYNGAEWVGTASSAGSVTTQGFTGDNSTTDFTLSNSATAATIFVSLNGVGQEPNVAYSVSGTTLTFSEPPASTDRIEVRYLSLARTTTVIVDSDGDTKIDAESSADEDVVRLTAAGTNMLSVSATAIIADSSYIPSGNYDLTTKNYVDTEISSITLDLSAVDQHIVPDTDETYDLGSATHKWRDLYLSGNTITLGSAVISATGSTVTLPVGSTINGSNAATESYVDIAESDAITTANAYTDSAVAGLATETYVDTAVSNLVDSAPATLDTLNELASALGDDANFATTVTTSLSTKLATADFNSTFDTRLALKSTADITENSNYKYYTDIRAQNAIGVSGNGLTYSTGTITSNATSANTANTIVYRDANGDFAAGTITATATSAQYADLAELYLADKDYEPGTVLTFSGSAEVTQCFRFEDRAVMGVVSANPAYLMNSDLNNGTAVALTGRVPVKVAGEVRPGDLLVTSSIPGHATVNNAPNAGTILGKAITGNTAEQGIVEALIILG